MVEGHRTEDGKRSKKSTKTEVEVVDWSLGENVINSIGFCSQKVKEW